MQIFLIWLSLLTDLTRPRRYFTHKNEQKTTFWSIARVCCAIFVCLFSLRDEKETPLQVQITIRTLRHFDGLYLCSLLSAQLQKEILFNPCWGIFDKFEIMTMAILVIIATA